MNAKLVSLILSILVFALLAIGVFLIIGAMGVDAPKDEITGQYPTDIPAVSRAVDYSMVLLWAAGIFIGVFTVWAIIQNPKRFIPTGIGLAVFGVLIFIASTMVTIETEGPIMDLADTTPDTLYWGGLGIQATFVLATVAIALILLQAGAGILSYFKK